MGINNGKSGKTVSVAGIEALFSEFEALYGVRFADMWRGTDIAYVKSLWAKALSGLTVREVRFGLDQCRFKPWPPSLPEFLGLCRPPPDPEKAFVAAQGLVSCRQYGEDVWPDKALYWTAVEFGLEPALAGKTGYGSRFASGAEGIFETGSAGTVFDGCGNGKKAPGTAETSDDGNGGKGCWG